MRYVFDIEGGNFDKAGQASSEIKKVMKQLGIEPAIIKRTVIALYEAEVNIVAHAYRGTLDAVVFEDRIVLRLCDVGPGIEDIAKAKEKGYSTASPAVREMGFGAGMGLYNMEKNADVLRISSEVGQGTVVEIVNYLNNRHS
ncbi:MAG TPA: ATP-binding protein [Bacteroidales bacterium]|nr:ATP-binding protein [Lentimicrobiaceae bacterium]HOH99766.1 ATP-binding protein [Bacteroidales bacterium]